MKFSFRRLILISIILGPAYAMSQDKIDSLRRVIKSSSLDSVRLATTLSLMDELSQNDPKTAIQYGEKFLKEASLMNVGAKGQVLNKIAENARLAGDRATGLKYASEAIQLLEGTKNEDLLASSLALAGSAYDDLTNYPKALNFLLRALEMREAQDDYDGMMSLLNQIGVVYDNLKDREKAIEYYGKNLSLAEEVNNQRWVASSVVNMGIAYLEMKEYESARPLFERGEHIFDSLGSDIYSTICRSQLAAVLDALGYHSAADAKHREALSKALELGIHYVIAETYLNRTDGFLFRKEPQLAVLAALDGVRISEANDDVAFAIVFYQRLSDIYSQLKVFDSAFFYQKKYQEVNDSIYNSSKSSQIAEMQTLYETSQKDREIANQKQQNLLRASELKRANVQRWTFLGGFVLVLIIGVTLFRSNQVKRQLNEKLSDTNQKLIRLDQFKKRTIGMIAHDIKNPLNSILGLSTSLPGIYNSGRRILTMINNMLDIQRFEDAHLQLEIESVNLDHLVNEALGQLDFQISEKNVLIETNTPSFTLRVDMDITVRILVNMLSNAIKFSPLNSRIQINALEHGEFVKISVSNEGSGVQVEEADHLFELYGQGERPSVNNVKSYGMGLAFCKLAVEAHRGTIGLDETYKNGALFWFTLPLSVDHVPRLDESVSVAAERDFVLSVSEKELLSPMVDELSDCKLYELSKIENILASLEKHEVENVQHWVGEVLDAVKNYNEKKFKNLLTIAK